MSAARTFDVIVVGAGVHGCSVAYHLAHKRPGRVALIDMATPCAGPTGMSTAVVRRYYGLDILTRLASASADVFQNWQHIIGGDPGFRKVGYLVVVDHARQDSFRENVARARSIGARVELVEPEQIHELVPQMRLDDIAAGSYEMDSGYADPEATTLSLVRAARQLGAEVLQHTKVNRLLVEAGVMSGVATSLGQVSAPVVVVCGGPWSDRLLSTIGLAVGLRAVRHQMCIFVRPPEWRQHPVIKDMANGTYMRPDHDNVMLHGIGKYGEEVDPDDYRRSADESEIERNVQFLTSRFPIMRDGVSRGGYASIYDVTPDGQPVLGEVPGVRGLYVNFGWSGHGFKHAPAVGSAIADVILHSKSAESVGISPFRWSRFEDGQPLPRDHSPVAARA